MSIFKTLYICPLCKGNVINDRKSFICNKCQKVYPITFGIPDFRVFGPRSNWDPRVYENNFRQHYEGNRGANAKELNDIYLRVQADIEKRSSIWLRDQQEKFKAFIGSFNEHARDRLMQIDALISQQNIGDLFEIRGYTTLDIGCGYGTTLKALSNRFQKVTGIDVGLIQLVVARRLLEEQGVENFVLVAACAEALPFPGDHFEFITILDAIEHVNGQRKVLVEAYRALMPGANLFLRSPNRFTLGPEQHVAVRGVGWLPRKWMHQYVKWVTRGKSEYFGKNLLSYLELRTLMDKTFGRQWYCTPFLVDRSVKGKSWSGRLYRFVPVPLLRLLTENLMFKLLCTTHNVLARK